MKKTWILLVASRYFRSRRKEKGHTAALLSVAGIAVGVLTLVVVLGVMNGFQLTTIDSLLEINSYHLRVSFDTNPDPEKIQEIRDLPGVRAAFPFSDIQTLVRGVFPDPQVCTLRALPADILEKDAGLKTRLEIRQGSFDLTPDRSILIGSEMARFLGVGAGDKVSLLNLSGGNFTDLKPENLVFTVTGVFKSGYYDYDLNWGFISLRNAESFLDSGSVPEIGVKLSDRYQDRAAALGIERLPGGGARVVSWRDYNRAIFSALRVEKVMMMVLIGLIFVVVAGNIFQSLRRSVYERTDEIGVLKTLGADPAAIRLIFVLEGAFIGIFGIFFGFLLGFLITGRINEIFMIVERSANFLIRIANWVLRPYFPGNVGEEVSLFSPAYFYLSEVPTRILLHEALLIACFALLSTSLAAYFASKRVATIKPAEVLRYE